MLTRAVNKLCGLQFTRNIFILIQSDVSRLIDYVRSGQQSKTLGLQKCRDRAKTLGLFLTLLEDKLLWLILWKV